MQTSRFADRTTAGSLGSFRSWQPASAMVSPSVRAIADMWRVICRVDVECYIKWVLSGNGGGARPHRGIDQGAHRGNAVRGQSCALRVLADELLVFREIHAIDLVARDE